MLRAPRCRGLQNWARNLTFTPPPERIYRPSTLGELCERVSRAPRLKVVGSAHSFNAIADSSGALLQLDGLTSPRIVALDESRGVVRVAAGLRYGELVRELAARGSRWALPNMASLPHISIGGAIATGTHGSGVRNGNLASSVTALQLVTAGGAVRELAACADAAFAAYPVHLGALGVVTEVELALVPAFELRQDVYEELPFAATLAELPAVLGAGYSVSLFTTWAAPLRFEQCWRKSVPATLAAEGGAPARWRGGVRASAERHPLPGTAATPCTPQLGAVGPSHARLPHFRMEFTPSSGEELQSEYFVDAADAAAALAALAGLAPRIAPLLLVSEVRAIAGDAMWMSPHSGRALSVAVHFTWKALPREVAALLPAIEAALAPFAARPHWGKLFAAPPAAHYARCRDFREIAAALDPTGKFHNDFLIGAGVLAAPVPPAARVLAPQPLARA